MMVYKTGSSNSNGHSMLNSWPAQCSCTCLPCHHNGTWLAGRFPQYFG